MVQTHKTLPPKPGKEQQLIPLNDKPETVKTALAGNFDGKGREGFLGKGNIIRKPDFVAHEELSAEEKARKKHLQAILGQVIEPNALSSRSTPAMDRRSLVNKLNKSTYDELMRLVPDSVRAMNAGELSDLSKDLSILDEDVKAEIQELYKNISP